MKRAVTSAALILSLAAADGAAAKVTTRVKAATAGLVGGALVAGPIGAVVGGVGGAVVGNRIQRGEHRRHYRHHRPHR